MKNEGEGNKGKHVYITVITSVHGPWPEQSLSLQVLDGPGPRKTQTSRPNHNPWAMSRALI